VRSAPTEAESYATTSTRIIGGIAIVIGLICLVDIAIEWRTRSGLIAAAVIVCAMILAYIVLVRPQVTLSPERLSVRNHVRDHKVPWSDVEGVDMADILRIQIPGRRLRCTGVQMMMRDLRRQRAGRLKPGGESSISRADFVVGRVRHHMDYYGKTSTGEVTSRWATPELIGLAVFALIAVLAYLLG
jgi:hypothetical protein